MPGMLTGHDIPASSGPPETSGLSVVSQGGHKVHFSTTATRCVLSEAHGAVLEAQHCRWPGADTPRGRRM